MNVLLMELATIMEESGMYLNMEWVPREENVTADALTNEKFDGFMPQNRMSVQIDSGCFPTLFAMMEHGKSLYEHIEQQKAENRNKRKIWPKVARHKKLRVVDPW